MGTDGTIFVGVVTHNSRRFLPACIGALRRQEWKDYRLVALDNASQDETQDWLEMHLPDSQVVLSNTNLGYGVAHNRILAEIDLCKDDYYLTLNPDVQLAPRYISSLVETLKSNEGHWGTGKLLYADEGGEPTGQIYSVGHAMTWDGYAFNIGHGLEDSGFDISREVFGAPGAAAIYSADFILTLTHPGGEFFDSSFFLYGEDTDIDWRGHHGGFNCWYAHRAVALHTGGNPLQKYYDHALVNRYLSVVKNAHIIDLVCLNAPVILTHLLTRVLLEPPTGLSILTDLSMRWKSAWARRSARMGRKQLWQWYQWAKRQPTNQPVGLLERIISFRRRKYPGPPH